MKNYARGALISYNSLFVFTSIFASFQVAFNTQVVKFFIRAQLYVLNLKITTLYDRCLFNVFAVRRTSIKCHEFDLGSRRVDNCIVLMESFARLGTSH